MVNSPIRFTKMQALGNDFVVIDAIHQSIHLKKSMIEKLGDRHIGVGCDQLLVIEPSEKADFFCRIFNSDGTEAEQCGNGLRCVARYYYDQGFVSSRHFKIETKAGIFPAEILANQVHLSLLPPDITKEKSQIQLSGLIHPLLLTRLSLGNPHAIVKVDTIDAIPLLAWAKEINKQIHFPEGVNLGFMTVINRNKIQLKTLERGAGETFSCGSNACAAVCAGMVNGWLDHDVTVQFRYGELTIAWEGEGHLIQMTGPAETVFTGEIMLS